MFLSILLAPIETLVFYVLPFIGTVFSEKNNQRWVAHWMITIFFGFTVAPFLLLIFDLWIVQFVTIGFGIGLLVFLTNEKARSFFGLVDNIVQIVRSQIQIAKERVHAITKQYGLTE